MDAYTDASSRVDAADSVNESVYSLSAEADAELVEALEMEGGQKG